MSKKLFVLAVTLLVVLTAFGVSAQDKVVIRYWDYWLTQGPAIDAGIAAFEAAHPNIDIEKTTQAGGGYEELVNAAFQGGAESTPDVFVIPDGNKYSEYVDQGWFLPLNTFPDFEDWKMTFENPEFVFMEGTNTIDGQTYSAKYGADGVWIVMFINTKVYADAGLTAEDYPTTLDQLIENSRIIRQNTDAYGVGFSGTQTWASGWWMWMCQRSTQLWNTGPFIGFDWTNGGYRLASDPCANAALEGLVTLKNEDLVLPDTVALALDDEAVRVAFATHRFAHLIAGDWVIAGWANTNPEFTEYDVIPLPLAGVDEPGGGFQSGPGGNWFAIAADTEHPEEAWEWFKYLHSEEFAQMWTEMGNGLLYKTPKPYDQFANHPAWASKWAVDATALPGPSVGLRNPDTAKAQFSFQGPSLDDIVMGVFTGQITDIPAALADLDARYTAGFEQGIADAQAAGAAVTAEDWLFPDWNPLEAYVQATE